MIRFFCYFVLLACSGCTAANDKTMLFHLEKQGGHFWVMGIAHTLPKGEFPTPATVSSLYKQASKIVLEVDYTDKKPIKETPIVLNHPRSAALAKKLLDEKLILPHMAEKISVASLEEVRDLFNRALEIHLPNYRRFNMYFENGFDRRLFIQARSENKLYAFLEQPFEIRNQYRTACQGAEEHFRFVGSMAQWLKDKEHPWEETVTALRIIGKSDFKKYENYLNDRHSQYEFLKIWHQCFIVPRNQLWASRVVETPQAYDGAFILVGADHLIGADNFLQLLEANGYQATNLKID